jgi:hypothetical protein
MPIPAGTKLAEIQGLLANKIAAYNDPAEYTSGYNHPYNNYIVARTDGIEAAGSLGAWIAGGGAADAIQTLLIAFGMNARNSELVPLPAIQQTLAGINPAVVNWVAGIPLPLSVPPANLVNPATDTTLSAELQSIYNALAAPGSVTLSGGYVSASKAVHCLFPELAPMIDGAHTGISYYNTVRATYKPPLGLVDWAAWIGAPIPGVANPSPRGAGRHAWQWPQFMAAVGVNQHIYELWQVAKGHPGFPAFLAIDPTPGTTGIPRIIDKGLW